MTEEEVETVAEELAKAGGAAWCSGREKDTLLKIVSDRYRDRARVAIEALDRFRTSRQSPLSQDNAITGMQAASSPSPSTPSEDIHPGATVIYRPPGDRRAYSCRVVEIKGSRAYLAPILRACTDWVSIEYLRPSVTEPDKALAHE